MLRIVDIPKLVWQVLRPNYAVTEGVVKPDSTYTLPTMTRLYKFILACLFILVPVWDIFDAARRKMYAVAASGYGAAQVMAYLNDKYGMYGEIDVSIEDDNLYFFPQNETPVYLYSTGNKPMLYQSNSFRVMLNIPAQLAADSSIYPQFVADINSLIFYGAVLTIRKYNIYYCYAAQTSQASYDQFFILTENPSEDDAVYYWFKEESYFAETYGIPAEVGFVIDATSDEITITIEDEDVARFLGDVAFTATRSSNLDKRGYEK